MIFSHQIFLVVKYYLICNVLATDLAIDKKLFYKIYLIWYLVTKYFWWLKHTHILFI